MLLKEWLGLDWISRDGDKNDAGLAIEGRGIRASSYSPSTCPTSRSLGWQVMSCDIKDGKLTEIDEKNKFSLCPPPTPKSNVFLLQNKKILQVLPPAPVSWGKMVKDEFTIRVALMMRLRRS